MFALSTFLSRNIGLIIFTTVCLGGVVFLLWFLIELQLDERRMRGRPRRTWGKAHTFKAIPIDSKRGLRAYSAKSLPETDVLGLSDKKIGENTRKLRWLVMLLVLTAMIQFSAAVGL